MLEREKVAELYYQNITPNVQQILNYTTDTAVSIEALSKFTALPPIIIAFEELQKEMNHPTRITDGLDFDSMLVAYKEVKRLKANNFSYLLNQSIVYLYSAIEASLFSLLKGYLIADLESTSILNQKIKNRAKEKLDNDEKGRYLLDTHKRNVKQNRENETNIFDRLLRDTPYNGSVGKALNSKIIELELIRNCIIHYSSTWHKSLDEVPNSLSYEDGQEITLEFSEYQKYFGAILDYFVHLGRRISYDKGSKIDLLLESIEESKKVILEVKFIKGTA
jgi:hypothetical protein